MSLARTIPTLSERIEKKGPASGLRESDLVGKYQNRGQKAIEMNMVIVHLPLPIMRTETAGVVVASRILLG